MRAPRSGAVEAFGGALVHTPDGWVWRDDGSVEPTARTIRVADLIPAGKVGTVVRYGVALVEVDAATVDTLPDPARELVHAALQRHGRSRMVPGDRLDGARVRLRETWTLPGAAWTAVATTPIACELDTSDGRRALARAARWHEATLAAQRTEAAIASTMHRWYAVPRRYAERSAAQWAHVLDVLLVRLEPDSAAFWRAEAIAYALARDDVLVMFPDELEALAEAAVAMSGNP